MNGELTSPSRVSGVPTHTAFVTEEYKNEDKLHRVS
jgi:hypothetical protein